MAIEITNSGILAFVITFAVLLLFSIYDLRLRKVSNYLVLLGLVAGIVSGLVSNHLTSQLILHLSAVIFVGCLVLVLFKIGAVGGADAKVALTIGVISPGVEFVVLDNAVFEAVLAVGVELLVMLLLGYLYQRRMRESPSKRPAPLIPFLFIGYLLVQMLLFL
ncbi:MAG: prepilin peptidase [Candidatus Thorarchaeota archaeon]